MDEYESCNLDYFPENILIDVLSYLSVRELVRAGRVCKRWKRLIKDQRLWRTVDLTGWKGVTSRILWVLLRQYFGCGLRCLRLRGLLLSARGGTFLSESWLKALSTKCPRLSKLCLLHADLRSLPGCQVLPRTLRVLELRGCELPRSFFNQTLPKGKGLASPLGIGVERLVLNNVPSFTDQHLQNLASWERLSRLELRDTFRVTANGLRSCAAKEGLSGPEGLSRLKYLEIGITARQGYQLQMASLGLGAGWLGLEELSLGGKEVATGLLCASRLKDLKCLHLWACTLSELQIVRSCRMLRGLRQLEFLDVIFQPRQSPPAEEGQGQEGGEEQQNEEEGPGGESNDENRTLDGADPFPGLRRSLAVLLPSCSLVFTNCSVQMNAD
uniref:F-box and leucine rich repeat protein 12 n=1 Tax=Cyprinodon variegatus TaxID=28743 RepID=A0A3Q2C7X8_CYPVA